ncbi:MAG: N-6 DNA methylase [Chloroflexota bacterium]|nr:N-6 DNA methylase [Chloroflexota bacterium]
MPTPLQLKTGISSPHRNRYLFSDHYLENILPDDPRWEQALAEAEGFCAWLRGLYADERDQLADYNEGQLEEHWFKPIFRELGHVFETQASVPGLDAYAKYPDYVFFSDEATRQMAAGLQNQEDYAAEALAVGEVKRWDTHLGKKRRGGGPSFEDQNPSFQIDYYVRTTGLSWGVLTNGRLWRLVHADSSQRLNIYYEVDLIDLLHRDDPALMRYFVLFFRQAALRPDAQGRVFLDYVLAASNAYAIELEEDLEQNVYQALERLMQGFLDLSANRLGPEDLRQIYDNSLYLLYRLLFILYGESRGLLPLQKDRYRTNYSLTRIKEEIADLEVSPAPQTTIYWPRLQNLFHIINGDDAELNRYLDVPRYNGGLFDPHLHPFLEEKAVGDWALVKAIDLLSRRTTETGGEFVDYRTLGVRHLGSIYEGLLEYRPRIAEEPMVAVGDEWVKTSEVSEDLGGLRVVDRRARGEVYLETDRGERKATGSYYTPQYIVEYIVEHTLGPLVAQMSESANGQAFVNAILDLKILDPAMGSGHFLVEATEFLTLELATDPYVEIEDTPEEDLTHWKRRVVERCIYGVDKNPLAVELAKLSLWLATVAADRPLSFLDHHLKCGDSLIGARVEDLGEVPPVMLSKKALKERKARHDEGARQANLFETRLIEKLPVVMGRILEITEQESKDYDAVRAKEAADQAVQQLKAPFEAVADLWTSAYFGNAFVNGEYDQALMAIGQPDRLLELDAVERARDMAKERRFFHWELAFPEVFYDENGQRLGERAGFDAVVGNPPYQFGEHIPSLAKPFLEARFDLAQNQYDTYWLFYERVFQVLTCKGFHGFIIPDAFLARDEVETVRAPLLEEYCFHQVAPVGAVFDDPNVSAVVVIWQNRESDSRHSVEVWHREEDNIFLTREYPQRVLRTLPGHKLWVNLEGQHLDLVLDILLGSRPMGELILLSRGEELGKRDLVDAAQADSTYAPILVGGDIEPLGFPVPQYYVRRDKIKKSDAIYEEQKIVLVKTGATLNATVDTRGQYTLQSIYNLHLRQGVEVGIHYLAALLKSSLLNHILWVTVTSYKDLFPQINQSNVESLPIRGIDSTTPADERERLVADGITEVTEWIERTEKDSVESVSFSAFSGSNFGRWLDERLSAEPEQSDIVHDLLAHLAERMIAMHEEKQKRVEAFWLDLEGVTDAATFKELREHGKWESSLWKAEPCRPFVDEESRSTRHLDESLGWNEGCFKVFVKMLAGRVSNLSEVVGVYRNHHPEYDALVRRIEATDRLIDQIVYILYGLTEEEVAVVERERG